MDLYLTLNLTENLYNLKMKRKKKRENEEENTKMIRIKSFLDAIHNSSEKMGVQEKL